MTLKVDKESGRNYWTEPTPTRLSVTTSHPKGGPKRGITSPVVLCPCVCFSSVSGGDPFFFRFVILGGMVAVADWSESLIRTPLHPPSSLAAVVLCLI